MTTEQESKAIYTEMISSIITLTKAAKAAGFTGKETWEYTKTAIMQMTRVPENIAAFLIRDAWKQASKEPRQ